MLPLLHHYCMLPKYSTYNGRRYPDVGWNFQLSMNEWASAVPFLEAVSIISYVCTEMSN